jgi:phosphatidylglycerol lysyltransferase
MGFSDVAFDSFANSRRQLISICERSEVGAQWVDPRAYYSNNANLMLLRRTFCSLFSICGSAPTIALSFTALFLGMSNLLRADEPLAPTITLPLKRGPFGTYHFVPMGTARAVVLFGSGDGGWGHLENRVCSILVSQGIYAVGIDFNKYADADYDAETLASDFATITQSALARSENPDLPVIYSGWSMGAVQAVAAAGGENRPQNLVGLVLLSMDKRGRYGLRLPERVGLEPEGEGTFGVADFTVAVANLRVVQFAAADDWMNNTDWIRGLPSPHRLFELENSNHDFNGADQTFENELLDGISWILDPAKSVGDRTTTE